MTVTIQMLDINDGDFCNNDFLEVREKSGSGKVIGN